MHNILCDVYMPLCMCVCLPARAHIQACMFLEIARMVVKISGTVHLWLRYHTYMDPVGPNPTQSVQKGNKRGTLYR